MALFSDRKAGDVVLTDSMHGDGGEPPERKLDMPWWVRAITVVGLPGVLVLYMVWVSMSELPVLRAAVQENITEVRQTKEQFRDHMNQTAAMYRMLQRICSNTASDNAERNRCFED